MAKPRTNYIIDALMAIAFLVSAVTGLIMFFFLPGGVRQGGYQEFLGIIKHSWSTVHVWSGIVMILLVIIHVVLHWGWIVCMTKEIFGKRKNKKNKR